MKALLVPYTMALLSSLAALIFPKTALKLADKAAIYSGRVRPFLHGPSGGKGN